MKKVFLIAFALLTILFLSGCQTVEEESIDKVIVDEYINECVLKIEESGDNECLTEIEDYLNERIEDEQIQSFGVFCNTYLIGDMVRLSNSVEPYANGSIMCLKEMETDKKVECQFVEPVTTLTMSKDYEGCWVDSVHIECIKGNPNYVLETSTTTEKYNCTTQNYIDYAYGGNEEEYYKDFQDYLDTYGDEAFEVGYENSNITTCTEVTSHNQECREKTEEEKGEK